MSKERVSFNVNINDCRVDTFTVGGNGGSGKDTSNTGVRITHPPSGAVGRAVDSRSQARNRELAWRRMGESKEFRAWAKRIAAELSSGKSIEQRVEEAMSPDNLRVEVRNEEGRWELDDAH